jgi:hypothetical protein
MSVCNYRIPGRAGTSTMKKQVTLEAVFARSMAASLQIFEHWPARFADILESIGNTQPGLPLPDLPSPILKACLEDVGLVFNAVSWGINEAGGIIIPSPGHQFNLDVALREIRNAAKKDKQDPGYLRFEGVETIESKKGELHEKEQG